MVMQWAIRRVRLATADDELKAELNSKVQALMTVPNRTGLLFFPTESEGEDLSIASNTQVETAVPMLRLTQNDSETVELFKDRVMLFCMQWVHRLSVAVAQQVSSTEHPAEGFTLLMSDLVPLDDANKVAVYVQVLCHARSV